MPKRKLKKRVLQSHGLPVPDNLALVDTDRIIPKLDGGTYDDPDNVRVLEPREHMERHGILRDRPQWLDELKTLFDDRAQILKLRLKMDNQLLAYRRRTDSRSEGTEQFIEQQIGPVEDRLKSIDKEIEKRVKACDDSLVKMAMQVPGLGPITVGALRCYVELEKAPTPSSLWQYVGLDRPSHERYDRNLEQQRRRVERGPDFYGSSDAVPTGWGGNKTLRTQLWVNATTIVKLNGIAPVLYASIYYRTKDRLSNSEKSVKTRNTQGVLVETEWKNTKPSHRHGAALRAVVKRILLDWWIVGRQLAGLPTRSGYAAEYLGHTTQIPPQAFGWPEV